MVTHVCGPCCQLKFYGKRIAPSGRNWSAKGISLDSNATDEGSFGRTWIFSKIQDLLMLSLQEISGGRGSQTFSFLGEQRINSEKCEKELVRSDAQ